MQLSKCNNCYVQRKWCVSTWQAPRSYVYKIIPDRYYNMQCLSAILYDQNQSSFIESETPVREREKYPITLHLQEFSAVNIKGANIKG